MDELKALSKMECVLYFHRHSIEFMKSSEYFLVLYIPGSCVSLEESLQDMDKTWFRR
jgi:hypothetical protein